MDSSSTASRLEAAAARREKIASEKEDRAMSSLKEKLTREAQALKSKSEMIQERKERAAASLEDFDVVLSRAGTIRNSAVSLESLHEKSEKAEKKRQEKLAEKREKARATLDDVDAILARASINDARRSSCSHIERLDEKDKKAAALRSKKLEEKRNKARASLSDVSAALSRVSIQDSLRNSTSKLANLTAKEQKAIQIRNSKIEQKREVARKSVYEVEKTRAHAQIQDAIRKSTARQERKELELKIDLARDRRASQVERVKEKQAYLQDAKYSGSTTTLQEADS